MIYFLEQNLQFSMTNFQKSTPNPSFEERRGTKLGLKLNFAYVVGKNDW
jgi:hypothetical protein